MEQYINEYVKPMWKGVSLEDAFSGELFYEVDMGEQPYTSNDETGYRDPDRKSWLASGNKDVRYSNAATIGEAIEWGVSKAGGTR